jgi:TonB family protein
VFLDRLESGFLLFETQQGLVRVELSFRQRIYLLWTFRHFRQLSVPLLNSRQKALVNALFSKNTGVILHPDESWLAIGVIENFVPPPMQFDASPTLEVSSALEPALEREWQEPQLERHPPAETEEVETPSVAITPMPELAPSASPRFAWSRLATTVGALALCLMTVAAWLRIQGMPGSEAHNQSRIQQVNAIVLPSVTNSATPDVVAESPTAVAAPPAIAQSLVVPAAVVKPAPIAAVIPTRKQAIRVHEVPSTPSQPLSGQDGIQASRPPLRFAYPVLPNVRARGVVALTARVDSDGTVRAVRVVSGHRALAAAAVRAVRQWRYRPYLKDGQPVATETNIVISFISEDAISMNFPPSIPAAR